MNELTKPFKIVQNLKKCIGLLISNLKPKVMYFKRFKLTFLGFGQISSKLINIILIFNKSRINLDGIKEQI